MMPCACINPDCCQCPPEMKNLSAAEKAALTRAALGPRLGVSPKAGHRVTTPTRMPRATGAPRGASDEEHGYR